MKALAAGGLAVLSVASAALAQDRGVVFAGAMVDAADYASLGGQYALPGSVDGRGLSVRLSGFLGRYDYLTDDRRIDATFGGGELDGVYQASGGWGFASLFAGARYVDTRLSPNDPTNRRDGGHAEPDVGTDGSLIHAPWRTDWYAAYGASLSDRQARIDVTHALGQRFRAGLEGGAEGDPTYSAWRVGPFAALRLGASDEAQISAGVSEQSGQSTGAYLRLGCYRAF